MAKRQTRRAVSMTGLTYQRLKKWCEANDKAASETVTSLITEYLDSLGVPRETVLDLSHKAKRAAKARAAGSQHFTW